MAKVYSLTDLRSGVVARPFDQIRLAPEDGGAIQVEDGGGTIYWESDLDEVLLLPVGGVLGWQRAYLYQGGLEDDDEEEPEVLNFRVEARTEIRDRGGEFNGLLQMLHFTMLSMAGEAQTCIWEGKLYRYFVCWLRDHVHVLKGMKYFSDDLKSAIDLYADTQREDGMIYDNCYPRGQDENTWIVRFSEGDFYKASSDKNFEMKRIPVENDVEYLFVEGLYWTWQATGDTDWMIGHLDAAIKALDYSIRDTDYRYSTKYGLLKRGYTIDTWDFQSEHDRNVEGDIMRVRPGTTRFGVMFGDNTGYANACELLALMLYMAERHDEGVKFEQRAPEIRQRLDDLSWQGTHYRHHVREESTDYDFGVDEAAQVSLSNAYSMNRNIGEDKMQAIAKTYKGIRAALPVGSPGEWYTIYPPFERGFGGHSDQWQYMNASVTPIVAGELARGCFLCGEEEYGADILRRLIELGKKHGNRFHCSYTGSIPPPPIRSFWPLDLAPVANADMRSAGSQGVPGWQASPNDLRELPSGKADYSEVPFQVLSGPKAAAMVTQRSSIDITVPDVNAKSLYLLHTVSGGSTDVVGTLVLQYTDGTEESRYVVRNQTILGWWMPEMPAIHGRRMLDIGWKGKNDVLPYVGVSVGAYDLAPGKTLAGIRLEGGHEDAQWWVFGATLSDAPAYFPTLPVSFGIPDGWGAAAVVYALIEGLAGVVDRGIELSFPTIHPRWEAAGVDEVDVTVHYPASDGYIAYQYRHDRDVKKIEIVVTGSGALARFDPLIPKGRRVVQVLEDGLPIEENGMREGLVSLQGVTRYEVSYA